MAYDIGDITWYRLDASRPFEETCTTAATLIEALSNAGAKETSP
jgi:hypothetical protein